MITLERMIQKVSPGKFPDLEELDKKFVAVETRLGFPPKKRYQCVIGGHDTNTVIVERQWDSMAAMEAKFDEAFADAEYQALRRSRERDDNRAHHYRS
jgi:hypothetical protein